MSDSFTSPFSRAFGTRPVVIVAVIVVALVLVGVLVAVFVIPRGAPEGQPSTPVEGYLAALADGDADAALGFIETMADDSTLLTDDVLAASNALAPISDVTIGRDEISSGSGSVWASYRLGDTAVDAEFRVNDYDNDGVWLITGGLGQLGLDKFAGIGLTVNGEAVDGGTVSVFPGAYELAVTSERFALEGATTVAVTQPSEVPDLADIDPVLTEAALAEFRSLVRAAVDGCIASTQLATDCGLALPATLDDGTQLVDGTIERSLPANTIATLDHLTATLSFDNPTLAQGEAVGSVSTSAQCSRNGSTGTCSVLFAPTLGRPSVDMTAQSPVVLWD